jgi:hypothetical protein
MFCQLHGLNRLGPGKQSAQHIKASKHHNIAAGNTQQKCTVQLPVNPVDSVQSDLVRAS